MHDQLARLADAVDAFSASDDYARYLSCLHAGRVPDVAALLPVSVSYPDEIAREAVLYEHACSVATRHGLAVQPDDLLLPYQSGQVDDNAVRVSAHAPYAILLDAVLGAVAARWLARQGVVVEPARGETYAAVAAYLILHAVGIADTLTARELALRGVTGLLVRAAAPYSIVAANHVLNSLHQVSAGLCGRASPPQSRVLSYPLGPGVEEALWASLQTCDHLHIVLAAGLQSAGDAVIQRAADEAHAAFAGALERVATGHEPDPMPRRGHLCHVCREAIAREAS